MFYIFINKYPYPNMNENQVEARSNIYDFLDSKTKKIFVLNGSAGTGKTYLITNILNEPRFQKMKIAFSATTNKAVSVLQNMSKNNKNNKNIDFITIHKLLKIKRKIDSNGTETYVINISESPRDCGTKSIYYYNIIIIDEASMINDNIYHQILRCSSKMKGKIIFLGDPLQLPPVNEIVSKVFNNNDFTLSKVVRNNSNILILCNRIRENIQNSSMKIKFKNLVSDQFSIFKDRSNWLDSYCDHYKNDKNPIILAYTNKCCLDTNIKVRNKLFSTNEKYIENELIVFDNYYKAKYKSFHTSQQCKITSLEVIDYKIQIIDFKHILNLKYKPQNRFDSIPIVNPKNIEQDFLCPICFEEKIDELRQPLCGHTFCTVCLKLWLNNKNTCPMCRVEIDIENNEICIKDNPELSKEINVIKSLMAISLKIWKINLSGEFIYVIHDNDLEKYNKIIINIKIHLQTIKTKIGKNDLAEIILVRLWEYVYAYLIDNFADISYGYCITTHKSQGSTYPNVYVDSRNILAFNNQNNDALKCFYTAISRTSEYLALYY